MTFRDVARRIMRQTRLNPDWFAVEVTYTLGTPVQNEEGEDEYTSQTITIHKRHRTTKEQQADGTTAIVDLIDVEIDDQDLAAAPDWGDQITLPGESDAYLYAYAGHHRIVSYKATFRRQRVTTQGVRGER